MAASFGIDWMKDFCFHGTLEVVMGEIRSHLRWKLTEGLQQLVLCQRELVTRLIKCYSRLF